MDRIDLISARHSACPGQAGQDGVHVLFGKFAVMRLPVRSCVHGSP
jgi:hypothetical protein